MKKTFTSALLNKREPYVVPSVLVVAVETSGTVLAASSDEITVKPSGSDDYTGEVN